jgi:penicillin amidase
VIGGGIFPFPGSGETLHRAIYDFKDPFKVTVSASLRMVADLNDDDKVLAVLPGGVSGRIFHPHATDQLKAFVGGDQLYWWFSDKAIQEHTKATLVLKP